MGRDHPDLAGSRSTKRYMPARSWSAFSWSAMSCSLKWKWTMKETSTFRADSCVAQATQERRRRVVVVTGRRPGGTPPAGSTNQAVAANSDRLIGVPVPHGNDREGDVGHRDRPNSLRCADPGDRGGSRHSGRQ
jgi:hypothetical protein